MIRTPGGTQIYFAIRLLFRQRERKLRSLPTVQLCLGANLPVVFKRLPVESNAHSHEPSQRINAVAKHIWVPTLLFGNQRPERDILPFLGRSRLCKHWHY